MQKSGIKARKTIVKSIRFYVLKDIASCLRDFQRYLSPHVRTVKPVVHIITPFKSAFHHLGFGKNVSRSNLSKANEIREVKIFQEFADKMVSIAREKRGVVKDFFISHNVYAFDSSTISLCLFVYWWTKLHHGKGGVKLHELYDVKIDIPTFSVITDASVHDSQVMELIPYEKESFYIFDRAYMATEKLYIIEEAEATTFLTMSYVAMKCCTFKTKDINLTLILLSVVFVLKFALG